LFVDERRQTGIAIRLIFEPLAGASRGCSTEIYQQRLVLFFGSSQGLIGVGEPVYGHGVSSLF